MRSRITMFQKFSMREWIMPESEGNQKSNACCTGKGGDIKDEAVGNGHDSEVKSVWKSSRAIKNWIGGAVLGFGLILHFFHDLNLVLGTGLGNTFYISDIFFLISIAIGGNKILLNGYKAIKDRNLNISLLMSSAIIGSIIATVFGGKHISLEGATLAFLFNLAELLEGYSIERVKGSLQELMDLSPDTAVVKREREEEEVPVSEVEVGDTVVIRPGEGVPVDGEVIEGNSSINEAPITGESIPVDKSEGDEVYAGTINEQGYLEVKTTTKSSESTISKIIDVVEDAKRKKTKHEKFVEKFSSYYTPGVVIIAIVIGALPPLLLGEPWAIWFVRAITMLVLACPCAFVISTPVSVVSGITSAAKNGVLIESGTTLEALGEVKVMAFDKTGTLTKGDLTVTDIIPLNGQSQKDVIRSACGVEERSEHPIADAIVNHVKENHDISHDHSIEEFREIKGKGVKANLEGEEHYAGKPSLIEELGFDLEHVHHSSNMRRVKQEATRMCSRENCLNLVEETIPRLQNEGKTAILVTRKNELVGIIAVADEVRPEAGKVVEKLNSFGIKTVMLTGDNENTAKAIAGRIGIDDYRAELMPEEKVEAIRQLSKEYGNTAMIGDGINDAPALAAADIGIAMGAAGTDTALETADIALMQDDISKLPYLQNLSARAKTVIRENIFASLGIKAALAIGVPLGYVTITLAVLAGDAGMTLGVTGNAMRLSKIKPEL
ncbi:cadmium-transporting ATPase [archaeon SCG-AAA382B04]|nr:cadmium-transporting ATPase [archaeon SCG-AAA382B04]